MPLVVVEDPRVEDTDRVRRDVDRAGDGVYGADLGLRAWVERDATARDLGGAERDAHVQRCGQGGADGVGVREYRRRVRGIRLGIREREQLVEPVVGQDYVRDVPGLRDA